MPLSRTCIVHRVDQERHVEGRVEYDLAQRCTNAVLHAAAVPSAVEAENGVAPPVDGLVLLDRSLHDGIGGAAFDCARDEGRRPRTSQREGGIPGDHPSITCLENNFL
eukprot:7118305-Prymnesium_polylepis.4